MIRIESQKVYTMNVYVEKGNDDLVFNLIKENYEEGSARREPFKNVKKINDFIREMLQPRVPFKNRGYGWRTCKANDDKYLLVVNFELSKEELDFI